MAENKYEPDIAIHPGVTLLEILESLKMSQAELASRSDLTTKTINEIIKGKNPITPDTAIKLSEIFGMSATFWNNLERNYQETKARLKSEEKIVAELPILKKFTCYKDLVVWDYIKDARDDKQKVVNLRNFFSVSSLNLIQDIHPIAFRKSNEGKISNECLAAWLRCGELEALKIETQKFDKNKIIDSIGQLRSLTKEPAKIFQSKLIDICTSAGIAVVFVPHFKNTLVYGATEWLNTDKAMIQLSLRGSYVDIFWFTFFHELGHLIKHGKKDQFVEFENKRSDEKEKEADEFASNTLIPHAEYEKFIAGHPFFYSDITTFADGINISPSIVAGRLAHDRHCEWGKMSRLRTMLKFAK